MSYEGVEEYICDKGHYWVVNSYFSFSENEYCPHCKKLNDTEQKPVFWRSVNLTNGQIDNDPSTEYGRKIEIGFDDLKCEDHYANQYFVKIMKYKPDPEDKLWRSF